MSIADASFLLISGLFGAYGLASSIEYATVYQNLAAGNVSRKLAAPLWEASNAFLIFGFAGLILLFGRALSHQRNLLSVAIAGAITILVRASITLGLFYSRDVARMPDWLRWLFELCTILAPMEFAVAGIYLLTGQMFWQSLLGLSLFFGAFCGLSAVGLLIAKRDQPLAKQLPGQLIFSLWLLVLGCILPIISLHTQNRLAHGPLLILVLASCGGLGLMLINFAKKQRAYKLWPWASILCLATPVVLAWANLPYLVSGKINLTQSAGTQSYATAFLAALAFLALLAFLGLFWFARSFADSFGPPTKALPK